MTIIENKHEFSPVFDFGQGDKVITLSLFGANPKYLKGSLRFVASAHKNLPGWAIVFFVGRSIPESHLHSLTQMGTRVCLIDESEGLSAMSWRFRIWLLGNPGWVISRDADSIISRREAGAVREWVESGATAHIIRDHPFHFARMLGGLWGIRPPLVEWFSNEVFGYNFNDAYGSDQDFLATRVYPRILNSSLIHASFHAHERPSEKGTFEHGNARLGEFCGESVTSSFLVRGYARLRRLIGSRDCKCVL